MGVLTTFRLCCYLALSIFSAATIGMTAARLHYTLHIPAHDPLNGGVDFYDRIIPEILATACLSLISSGILFVRILRRHERGFLSTLGGELIVLVILFILWIVGAAVATQKWGDLGWCRIYNACRLLTAIVAFTWMSWIVTFFLVIACLVYIIKYKGFRHHAHGGRRERREEDYHGDYPGDMRQV